MSNSANDRKAELRRLLEERDATIKQLSIVKKAEKNLHTIQSSHSTDGQVGVEGQDGKGHVIATLEELIGLKPKRSLGEGGKAEDSSNQAEPAAKAGQPDLSGWEVVSKADTLILYWAALSSGGSNSPRLLHLAGRTKNDACQLFPSGAS